MSEWQSALDDLSYWSGASTAREEFRKRRQNSVNIIRSTIERLEKERDTYKAVWTRKPEYGAAPCGWLLAKGERCPAMQEVESE